MIEKIAKTSEELLHSIGLACTTTFSTRQWRAVSFEQNSIMTSVTMKPSAAMKNCHRPRTPLARITHACLACLMVPRALS